MGETLLSVGLDVGTTTTQMVLSQLRVENCAGGFHIPDLQITERKVLQKSPVHFTPLIGENRVDSEGIRRLLEDFYRQTGVTPEQVDTGAAIITGETSRKENAAAVLQSVSHLAGDFVAATAGPHLESVLAAKGAGAYEYSKKTGKTVLHMDIGGGTANLALIREGEIIRTGCMNVGGRLLKFSSTGVLSYVSPVLHKLTDLRPGDYPAPGQVEAVAKMLTQGLEMAAGLRKGTDLLRALWTEEAGNVWDIPENTPVLSFSGGVADCIDKDYPDNAFGDMGVILGKTIAKSLLCAGEYILGRETIRATVIGAGSHCAQLSGSTVFLCGVSLPVKNLPVAVFSAQEQEAEDLRRVLERKCRELDSPADKILLYIPGYVNPEYEKIRSLASRLSAVAAKNLLVCTRYDMAKALGQALCLHLPEDTNVLCIDGLKLEEGSFLDIGKPVGSAFPVIIKTLLLENQKGICL